VSLYNDPIDEIYNDIAAKNAGVVLVREHYTLGVPVAVSDLNGTNTTITITSNTEHSAYEGSETVRYKRLNLSDLQAQLPTTLAVNGVTHASHIAAALTARYGIPFSSNDYIGDTYTLTNGTGTVQFRAASASLRWIGQMTVNIVPAKPTLASVVTVRNLDGYTYPYPDNTRPFAKMYSYWRDFTPAYVDGDPAEPGVLQDESLLPFYNNVSPEFVQEDALVAIALALDTVTRDEWVTEGTSRYSLEGAEVRYIGEITHAGLALGPSYTFNNEDYTHVCVVTLDPVHNLGYNGDLYLHFNGE
jgi:hypothetical protein